MFECFHCLNRSLIWDCDYDYEDFGYEGKGIVQLLHCASCGAEVEYRIPITDEDIEEVKEIYEEGAKGIEKGDDNED